MNINQMMKQAQQAQAKIEKAQKEIEEREFDKEVQGIKVSVTGTKQVLKVEIDEDLMDDKEMLEDMLVVAFNEVFKDVDTLTEELMSKATGNLKLPF
jgi:DNA-binding YbaB/EbfC family protein